MSTIHPTAIIHDGAQIENDVEIGPYCVVGPHVVVGSGTRLLSHVVVDNHTTLGTGNTIHPFARLGGIPQDLKFKGEAATLVVGDHNIIRENVTLNIGTQDRMETRIGHHNLFMAGSHVAHDCNLGNNNVLSNGTALAGHVDVGNHVTFGGLSAVHQFSRIGDQAFVAGGGMVNQDIPPFCIAQGDRAQLVGINIVGLKRRGWDRIRLQPVREAFKRLFLSSGNRLVCLTEVENTLALEHEDVALITDFIRGSKRGVCSPRLVTPPADNIEPIG